MNKSVKLKSFGSYKILPMIVFLYLFIGNGFVMSQNVDYSNTKLSFQANDERVDIVLNRLSKQADVRFFYNQSDVDVAKRVTVSLKDVTLNQLVNEVLKGDQVSIEFQSNRTIVLKKVAVRQIWLRKVSGKVVDSKNGEELIGVSIVLKERRGVGVITDVNGAFSIDVPEGITALQLSYVGYETEYYPIKSGVSGDILGLTVRMTPSQTELADVVVTGMAPRKKESFTGSYVTVKGEELLKLSPNNLLQALSFFDPSFTIVENSSRGSVLQHPI